MGLSVEQLSNEQLSYIHNIIDRVSSMVFFPHTLDNMYLKKIYLEGFLAGISAIEMAIPKIKQDEASNE